MAYTVVDKGSKYFVATPYTGDGANPRTVTTGLANDFVWIKSRTDGDDHRLVDSVRGASAFLESDSTLAEATTPANVLSFTSTGFTLSAGGAVNFNGETYASWAWVGGGTAVSNTSGTITSSVSANTTSGFSIVSYTGNATAGATVGHGIGSTIGMMLVKGRSFSDNWAVYHKSIGGTGLLELNGTGGTNTVSTRWNDTNAGATVFTLGNNSQVNGNGSTYIAYCFAEVKGYSKFGSYTGNGSTDGTFVYTGFKPAFVMTKSSSTGGTYYDWGMMDNKRANPFNVIDAQVCANLSDAENSANIGSQKIDFLSNGFKPRVNGSSHNGSGVTYIYMCFAENPFVSSKGIPTTAR